MGNAIGFIINKKEKSYENIGMCESKGCLSVNI